MSKPECHGENTHGCGRAALVLSLCALGLFPARADYATSGTLDLDDDATKSALERSDVRRRPDNDYAVSWVRRFGGGRVFYTSFGHDERAWLNGPTLKHILGGIQYALRDISTDESPSSPQFVNPSKK